MLTGCQQCLAVMRDRSSSAYECVDSNLVQSPAVDVNQMQLVCGNIVLGSHREAFAIVTDERGTVHHPNSSSWYHSLPFEMLLAVALIMFVVMIVYFAWAAVRRKKKTPPPQNEWEAFGRPQSWDRHRSAVEMQLRSPLRESGEDLLSSGGMRRRTPAPTPDRESPARISPMPSPALGPV